MNNLYRFIFINKEGTKMFFNIIAVDEETAWEIFYEKVDNRGGYQKVIALETYKKIAMREI